MRLRKKVIAMKSNQNYNKTYPEKQLAVIVEELSRKVLLCTQPEFFRILLHKFEVFPDSSLRISFTFLFRILHKFQIMLRSGNCEGQFSSKVNPISQFLNIFEHF